MHSYLHKEGGEMVTDAIIQDQLERNDDPLFSQEAGNALQKADGAFLQNLEETTGGPPNKEDENKSPSNIYGGV